MAYKTWKDAYEQIALNEKTITWHIDHINSFGNIEKELRQTGAKYVSMDRIKSGGIKVKFSYNSQGQKNKLTQLVLKHDIDAVDEGLQEVRYTNIYNKIKGIKNLSRKDADMIAAIDPFILGKVIEALAPMYEDINEGRKVSVTVDWEHGNPNDYSADWEAEGVFVLDYDPRKKEMEIGGEEKALAAWIEMTYGLSKNAARALMRSAKRVK